MAHSRAITSVLAIFMMSAAVFTSTSAQQFPYILFTTTNTLTHILPKPYFPEHQAEFLQADFLPGRQGVDYHYRLNLVFWTNMDVGEINQARLSDGGQIRTIVSGLESPGDLTVDWINDKLYWVDGGTRRLEELDIITRQRRLVLITGGEESSPFGISVFPIKDYAWLYWTDREKQTIERVPVNGQGRDVLATNAGCVQPITIDYKLHTIFTADDCTFQLKSLDLLADDPQLTVELTDTDNISFTLGMTLSDDIVYWTGSGANIYGVNRTELSRGNREVILVYDGFSNQRPRGMEIVDPRKQPDEIVLPDVNMTVIPNGRCILPGLCLCNAGWVGANCSVDVDECAANTSLCEVFCNNTPGSYFCSCGEGYQVSSADNRSCEDIDECATMNGGCEDICTNTDGAFNCACSGDNQLDNDNSSCIPLTISAPVNLTSPSQSPTSITISWSQREGDNVEGYNITFAYLGECAGYTQPENMATLNGTAREHTLQNLQEHSDYNVTITAFGRAGTSTEVSMTTTTLPTVPSAPPQAVMATSINTSSITIEWEELNCIDRDSDITGYTVRYGPTSNTTTAAMEETVPQMNDSATTLTVTGLIPGTSYTFEVAAVSSEGTGPFSTGTDVLTDFLPTTESTTEQTESTTAHVATTSAPIATTQIEPTTAAVEEEPSPQPNLIVIIAACVGGGGAIIVLFVIILTAVLLYRRHRRTGSWTIKHEEGTSSPTDSRTVFQVRPVNSSQSNTESSNDEFVFTAIDSEEKHSPSLTNGDCHQTALENDDIQHSLDNEEIKPHENNYVQHDE